MSALSPVNTGLSPAFDGGLVASLLAAHEEAHRNFYLAGHRLTAVEGGRFCEAALRMLEQRTKGSWTPVGKQLDAEKVIRDLGNLVQGSYPDSVRLHLPRALRLVYDIRNARDAAHLADGIDPNIQDSTLVISVIDWVLAEFIRLAKGIPATDAHQIVDRLFQRRAPAIQEFAGFPKVLNPKLSAPDFVLLLLYQRSTVGATGDQLREWVLPKMRSNLHRTLSRLVDEKALVHRQGHEFFITAVGTLEVERRSLLQLPDPSDH
jgi:hypothetical protein